MLKSCLVLALAGASLNTPASNPLFVNYDTIHLVDCRDGRGTAWRNGAGAYVSADHVTTNIECAIDGEPVNITYASKEDDLSSLRTARFGMGLKINCEGFKDGEVYLAVGHAEGKPFQRAMFVQASAKVTQIASWKGFYALVGRERFIPGMSGGPVFNKSGEVVGIVNGYNGILPISYSQPLSETALCGA